MIRKLVTVVGFIRNRKVSSVDIVVPGCVEASVLLTLWSHRAEVYGKRATGCERMMRRCALLLVMAGPFVRWTHYVYYVRGLECAMVYDGMLCVIYNDRC